jgi:uncharacterized protein YjiS (DUF1127 family)
MSNLHPAPALRQSRSAPSRAVMATFAIGIVKRCAAIVKRRSVRKTLEALDDHMLKDIGISRSDIDRIARGQSDQPGQQSAAKSSSERPW